MNYRNRKQIPNLNHIISENTNIFNQNLFDNLSQWKLDIFGNLKKEIVNY